ncbi:hypothetical protein HZS_2570, partial [Henneguya salminicola]
MKDKFFHVFETKNWAVSHGGVRQFVVDHTIYLKEAAEYKFILVRKLFLANQIKVHNFQTNFIINV